MIIIYSITKNSSFISYSYCSISTGSFQFYEWFKFIICCSWWYYISRIIISAISKHFYTKQWAIHFQISVYDIVWCIVFSISQARNKNIFSRSVSEWDVYISKYIVYSYSMCESIIHIVTYVIIVHYDLVMFKPICVISWVYFYLQCRLLSYCRRLNIRFYECIRNIMFFI